MIPIVVYPVPLDNWQTFKPDFDRFCSTWKEFPPGCEYQLFFMMPKVGLMPEDMLQPGVGGIWVDYEGKGADIGAHQHAANVTKDRVMVCLSTRVYFHRAGWLKRLMDCWSDFGPGLYGTAATRETGRLCLRTQCYMLRSEDFQLYPHVINSRARGYFFEWGDGNPDGPFSRWYENRGGQVRVVYWDSCSDIEWLAQDNIFRRGDQSNLLVWDRHTKIYEEADEQKKRVLHAMTFGLDSRNGEV